MANVLTIANRILELAREQGCQLTPLQLMKLVYMSHGWSLGVLGQPLFVNRVEAWEYGPVIPALYHETKRFGSSPVSQPLPAPPNDVLDAQTENLLEAVVKNYGQLSGMALSNLTHRNGSPWSKVWQPDRYRIEIPNAIIQAHYEVLKDSPTVSAA